MVTVSHGFCDWGWKIILRSTLGFLSQTQSEESGKLFHGWDFCFTDAKSLLQFP